MVQGHGNVVRSGTWAKGVCRPCDPNGLVISNRGFDDLLQFFHGFWGELMDGGGSDIARPIMPIFVTFIGLMKTLSCSSIGGHTSCNACFAVLCAVGY